MCRSFLYVLIAFCLLLAIPHVVVARCDSSTIQEPAMAEGMVIVAQTEYGVVEIRAGQGCVREYKWDGDKFKTEIWPRKERWYGHLGLYHPQLRPPHRGVVHMVAEEYQENYQSVDEAVKSMNKFDHEDLYSDDGLHVRFIKRGKSSDKVFINILVSQILINGEKPKKLAGSQNAKIMVK